MIAWFWMFQLHLTQNDSFVFTEFEKSLLLFFLCTRWPSNEKTVPVSRSTACCLATLLSSLWNGVRRFSQHLQLSLNLFISFLRLPSVGADCLLYKTPRWTNCYPLLIYIEMQRVSQLCLKTPGNKYTQLPEICTQVYVTLKRQLSFLCLFWKFIPEVRDSYWAWLDKLRVGRPSDRYAHA